MACGELDVVAKFINLVRVDPTLLNSSLVVYGAHEGGGELEEGASGSQPVGHVEQALVSLEPAAAV